MSESGDYLKEVFKQKQIERLSLKADIAEAVAMALGTQHKKGLVNYQMWVKNIRSSIEELTQKEEEETLFSRRKKSKVNNTIFAKLRRLKNGI